MRDPPYRTDDPEPTPLGHYQFYTFSTGTIVHDDTSGSLPAFELNYGLIPNGQLTIDAPVAFDSPSGGATQFGYVDTQVSFKYRFIQEDEKGWGPQVGVFPLVQLPTGDQSRGLGAGHVLGFLPILAQKSFGEWTTYGGGGYWINQGDAGDKHYWFLGALLQRKITDKLSVAGEIFHQTANTVDGEGSTWAPSTTSMTMTTSVFPLVEACKTPTPRISSPGTQASSLPDHSNCWTGPLQQPLTSTTDAAQSAISSRGSLRNLI